MQWYKRFNNFMVSNGYHISQYDSCVYYGGLSHGKVVYLFLYVDDMLIVSKYIHKIDKLKKLLNHEFKMKELGSAKNILEMKITKNKATGVLFLSQEKYVNKELE